VRALIYDRLTRALFVGERFVAGAQSAGSYDSLNCIRVRKKRELRLLRRTTLFPRRFRELVASGTCVYFKLIPFLGGCRYLAARSRFVSRKPRDPSRYFIISNSRYRNSQLHSRNSACSSSTRKQASRESMLRICRRRSYVKRNYLKFSFNQFPTPPIDLSKSTTRRLRWIHCSVNFRPASDVVALRSTREIRFS